MKIDVKKEIRRAVDTGKAVCGEKVCKRAIMNDDGELAITSKNMKNEEKEEVKYLSGLAKMPYYEFEGTSMELGTVCGKPFGISVMVIKNMGKSKLNQLIT
ncbi:MAG: 50S ribosomal protein L30e [archaeon]